MMARADAEREAVRYGAVLHLVHVSPRPMVVSEGLKECSDQDTHRAGVHAEPRYPPGAKLVASITALMSPWARQVGP